MHIYLLLQGGEIPFLWGKAAVKYVGFIAYFAIFGTLGFRFLVLGLWSKRPAAQYAGEAETLASVDEAAERIAARVGFAGSLLLLLHVAGVTARKAYLSHIGLLDALLKAEPEDIAQTVIAPFLALAFGLALRRARGCWITAALAGVALALRHVVTWRWAAQVGPLHGVAAALWLGTLFVLVVAGLPAIRRAPAARGSRGPLVARLVARFSTLALVAAGFVGLSGIVVSWLHLKYVAALWTTSYGYTLIAKLGVVAVVVALGAWNWRRMTPKLSAEEAAHELRRSSAAELVFAGVVLLLTAVLVSLPGPKLPKAVAEAATPKVKDTRSLSGMESTRR